MTSTEEEQHPRARRWRRRVSPWWCCFLVLFALGAVWSLTTPPFGAPDEASQVAKAMAVGHGNLFPDEQGEYLGGSGVETRQRLSVYEVPVTYIYDWTCFIAQPAKTAACAGVFGGDEKSGSGSNYHGGYPPLYYGLVGWPASVLPSPQSFYFLRLVSAALVAAFIASALQSAIAHRRSRLLALGVLVGATPGLFALGGSIHSSGFEIAAAICLWTTLLVLFTEPDAVRATSRRRRLVVRATIAGAALALARPVSPIWVVLIALIVLSVARRDALRALVRARSAWIGTALVALACAIAGVWILTEQPDRDFIRYAPGVGRPERLVVARTMAGALGNHVRDMVGSFGWSELSAPTSTMVAWVASISVLAVLALTIAKRRERLALIGLGVAIWVVPILLVMPTATTHVNGWVGRYTQPLAVGFPLMAGLVLDHHRERIGTIAKGTTTFVAVAVGVGQLTAYATVAHRYVVGTGGPILYPFHVEWAPRLPAWFLLVAAAAACGALGYWGRAALVGTRPSPFVEGVPLDRRAFASIR